MATRDVSDGTRTTERWTNEGTPGYYTGNPLTKQRDLTAAEAAELAATDAANALLTNRASIEDKALAALAVNDTYLTGASNATQVQVRTQVERLTRECSGLIRLLLQQLDSTEGT
jgi:hypothetical protein